MRILVIRDNIDGYVAKIERGGKKFCRVGNSLREAIGTLICDYPEFFGITVIYKDERVPRS